MTDRPEQGHHDDCEDCKRERKENQLYIAVYERMQSLRKNVEKTANGLKSHAQKMRTVRALSQSLDSHLINAAKSQGEADSRSIQAVGFEIASVMAQRIARKRLEAENESLKKRIQSLRKQGNSFTKQQKHVSLPKINQTKSNFYAQDPSIQSQNRKPTQMTQLNTNGWCTLQNDNDSCSTTKFSFFKNTRINPPNYRQKYQNLNLWLYERQNTSECQPKGQTFMSKSIKRHF